MLSATDLMSESKELPLEDPVIACLSARKTIVPFLDLSVALHSLVGLGERAQPRDPEEARNYRLFAELTGSEMLSARVRGSFKPPEFIHPFEEHYTLPGYLDTVVVPYLADAVDARALGLNKTRGSAEKEADFLAFIYMFFLLVHPFVDGNGRVARSLLDYYYLRLSFTGPCPWRILEGQSKFAKRPEHRDAFHAFFITESLPKRAGVDPYPIPDALRAPLRRMADRLIAWAVSFRDERPDGSHSYHKSMANLIGCDPVAV